MAYGEAVAESDRIIGSSGQTGAITPFQVHRQSIQAFGEVQSHYIYTITLEK